MTVLFYLLECAAWSTNYGPPRSHWTCSITGPTGATTLGPGSTQHKKTSLMDEDHTHILNRAPSSSIIDVGLNLTLPTILQGAF